MKVPLISKSCDKGIHIFRNSKRELAQFPFSPYLWAKEKFAEKIESKAGPYTGYDLFTKDEEQLYKLLFTNPKQSYDFFKANCEGQQVFGQYYDQQLITELPDFYLKYPNRKPLKIVYFDIEVETDGSGIFPSYTRNPIIAIGCKMPGKETMIFDNYSKQYADREILELFFTYVKANNTDLLVGYNNSGFDLPYIIGRSSMLNMNFSNEGPNLSYLSRYGKLPYVQKTYDGKTQVKLYGRVVFDVYNFVARDQSLFGIRNHKMATLANWYKIPYIDMDVTNTKKYIGTPELREYLKNDVEVTEKLSDIYMPLQIELAETMQVPFESIVNGSPNFIPKLIFGRNLLKKRIIPFNKNSDRYTDNRFQAAIVNIQKTGFQSKVVKVDYNSFYPSIMVTFNLGPDTTQILEFADYTGEYKVERFDNHLILRIPDTNFNKDVIIKVILHDGFLKTSMRELFAMRKIAKGLIKSDPENKLEHKTKSDAIKVKMNSCFGYASQAHAYWGDMGTGIAIVGLARWLITFLGDMMEGHIIETDTDGLYVDTEIEIDELNKSIINFISEHTKFEDEDIAIELERDYDGVGYFYKQKNYALMDDKGEIKKKGTAFKGTRLANIYNITIERVCTAVLHQIDQSEIDDIIEDVRTLDNYALKDFEMRTKINKDYYVNPNALQPTLSRRAKDVLKQTVNIGDSITYVAAIGGYRLISEVKDIKEIDRVYYSETIEKALAIFGYGRIAQKAKDKQAKLDELARQVTFDFIDSIPEKDNKDRRLELEQGYEQDKNAPKIDKFNVMDFIEDEMEWDYNDEFVDDKVDND